MAFDLRQELEEMGDIVGEYVDNGVIDIGRSALITLPDGSTTVTDPKIPIYTDVKCHLSPRETPNPDPVTAGTMPIIISLTIICSTDIDLQNADFITARRIDSRGNILAEYEGTIGVPVVNQSRQRAIMVARQAV